MNRVEQIFKEPKISFSRFFKKYTENFFDLVKSIDIDSIKKLAEVLLEAREREATIFVIGNGGSAATASHFAEDLALCAGAGKDKPFRTLSLTDNTSYISALGNDEGYEKIFVGQLRNLYRPGDILIVFSGSGNSPNLIKAIEYVNSKDGDAFGILGFDGGEAKRICRQAIVIDSPKGHYGPVESLHLFLIHIISNYLFSRLNGSAR
ncbi:MAG: SIS domain-containing protein [Patescibacteria group bacterium]